MAESASWMLGVLRTPTPQHRTLFHQTNDNPTPSGLKRLSANITSLAFYYCWSMPGVQCAARVTQRVQIDGEQQLPRKHSR